MRRACIVATLVWGLLLGAWATAATPAAKPNLPRDVLAVIEIRCPSALSGQFAGYAKAVTGNRPTRGLMPVAQRLVAKVRRPGTVNVNLPWRIAVIGTDDGIATLSLFRSTAPDKYLAALMPNIKKAGKQGNVHLYVQETPYFDRAAFMKAKPEERRDFQQFRKIRKTPVSIGIAGDHICMGDRPKDVTKMLQLVTSGKITDRPLLPDAPLNGLAGCVRVKALLDHLTATRGDPFANLRKLVPSIFAPFPGMSNAKLLRTMDAQITVLAELAAQVDVARFTVNVSAQNIAVTLGLEVVPRSALAEYLAAAPAGVPETLSYIPHDAMLVAGSRVGSTARLTEWGLTFQKRILSTLGKGPEEIEKALTAFRTMMEARPEEFTFAMLPAFKLNIVQITRYQDAKDLLQRNRKMLEIAGDMMDLYSGTGVKMTFDIGAKPISYKGHDILHAVMKFEFTAPDGTDPLQARVRKAQRKAIEAMYGTEMPYHATVIGRDLVAVTGEESLDSLKEIIDGKQKRIRDHAAFKKAVAALDPKTSAVLYLRLTDLAQMMMNMFRETAGPQAAGMIPNVTFEQGPGVAAGMHVDKTYAEGRMNIPAAEIKAVVAPFLKMRPPHGPGQPPAPAQRRPQPKKPNKK